MVVIDFEFTSIEEKDNFRIPDFCLVEVTDEEFLAGGMLCGKYYEDLEENLRNSITIRLIKMDKSISFFKDITKNFRKDKTKLILVTHLLIDRSEFINSLSNLVNV